MTERKFYRVTVRHNVVFGIQRVAESGGIEGSNPAAGHRGRDVDTHFAIPAPSVERRRTTLQRTYTL